MPSFRRPPSRVVIRRAASYGCDLAQIISESLAEFDLKLKGKRVLLKPNFVGVGSDCAANTHPSVVAAARDSFLRAGAASVIVGEGPALERDTEAILEEIRLREYIGKLDGVFVDLNVDDVQAVTLRTRASSLKRLCLPATALGADFVVSMPKLKTHHWAGVTLSLKNMFGIVPGICYGWPKNILHWAGISKAVLDLNSTVRPDFVIVDGIVAMEGNGPVQGDAKKMGLLILGDDPVATDATATRVMMLQPERVDYLRGAGILLGHVSEQKIEQIGERIVDVAQSFRVVPEFERLRMPLRPHAAASSHA